MGENSLLLVLLNNKDELTVYIPKEVATSESLPHLPEGAKIKVSGKVQEYKGKIELKIKSSYNIKIVEDQ